MTLKSLYELKGALIMGILNVTPDSFSDGGQFITTDMAQKAAEKMAEGGADLIDVGAESTRPGAEALSLEDEWQRLKPVLEILQKNTSLRLSVDTYKPEIARRAADCGVTVWNDVSGLTYDLQSLMMAAKLNMDVIIMHRKGASDVMQQSPHYDDVVTEVTSFLLQQAHAVETAGLAKDRIWIDPGIGFGKTLEHNLKLISATKKISSLGYPLMLAASRKRFIAAIEAREGKSESSADQRLGGSIAAHLWAIQQGAAMVRVHDVTAMKQALRVHQAIIGR